MTAPPLLADGLLQSAARLPAKTAIIDETSSCTYEQLAEKSSRLAGYLAAHGIQPGDRVVIFLDNGWPCAAAVYGVLMAGGVFVLVNPQTKSEKLHFILADCGATALITDRHLANQYEQAVSGLDRLLLVVSVGTSGTSGVQGTSLMTADLHEVMSTGPLQSAPVPRSTSDLAALIYTSGSTGEPKGVMQTQGAMAFAVGSIIEYLQITAEDRILLVLPMAFDYGLYQVLMSVFLGATVVVERSFVFLGRVYEVMRKHKVTVLPGVPTIFSIMQASIAESDLAFPDVRIVTSTAAVLHPSLLPALATLFPNARIFKMYGLTECKRVSYLDPDLLADHPESVGIAIPGTTVCLRDRAGNPVPPGEPGILHVQGPHIMAGYWNRPEATARMLRTVPETGEVELVAQDWFTQDPDGLLYFVGRSDQIIKTRGEKVSPVEVENMLCQMDGISQAAVIGVPDQRLGEQILAYVVAAPDRSLAEGEVRRFCAARLENFMVPQKIIFLAELPRTGNNKIDKKLLLEWSV